MSLKHQPIPDTEAVVIAKAIRRALDEHLGRGEVPEVIVLSEKVARLFREQGLGGGWVNGWPGLFGLPVRTEAGHVEWTIRLKPDTEPPS